MWKGFSPSFSFSDDEELELLLLHLESSESLASLLSPLFCSSSVIVVARSFF